MMDTMTTKGNLVRLLMGAPPKIRASRSREGDEKHNGAGNILGVSADEGRVVG